MKYLSVCSGIEAATAAWHPLGWKAWGYSEIEKFPSAVLKHHYPKTPNLGDMTKFKEWKNANIDVLIGGTPCQSFSVAGLRKGLDDPRGNLMLTYLAIAAKYRPRWVVWENVPGVLSSNQGDDFKAFLSGLEKCGYGWAYRVLDAQYFGVAQRRRRVFVVGYLGEWQRAAAVLFDSKSLQGHPAPSREARKEAARNAGEGAERGSPIMIDRAAFNQGANAQYEPKIEQGECSPTLVAREPHAVYPIHDQATRFNGKRGSKSDGKGNGLGIGKAGNPSPTLTKGDKHAVAFAQNTRDEVRLQGGDGQIAGALAAEPGMKQQTFVAIPQDTVGALTDGAHNGGGLNGQDAYTGRIMPVLIRNREGKEGGGKGPLVSKERSLTLATGNDQVLVAPTLTASNDPSRSPQSSEVTKQIEAVHASSMQVRRLTPTECERLQGFPDGYTNIPYGKPRKEGQMCPDSPRYKALGNSMAVPVIRWIGERIQLVESITTTHAG